MESSLVSGADSWIIMIRVEAALAVDCCDFRVARPIRAAR
jgi:hypothetical protein